MNMCTETIGGKIYKETHAYDTNCISAERIPVKK
jgi:hypothetical protein